MDRTNAQRQARWRERQKAKMAALESELAQARAASGAKSSSSHPSQPPPAASSVSERLPELNKALLQTSVPYSKDFLERICGEVNAIITKPLPDAFQTLDDIKTLVQIIYIMPIIINRIQGHELEYEFLNHQIEERFQEVQLACECRMKELEQG